MKFLPTQAWSPAAVPGTTLEESHRAIRAKFAWSRSHGDPEVQRMAEAGAGSSSLECGPDLDLEEKNTLQHLIASSGRCYKPA